MSTTPTPLSMIEVGSYDLTFSAQSKALRLSAALVSSGSEGVYDIEFTLDATEAIVPPGLTVKWVHPMVDTHLRWMTRGHGALPIVPWRGGSSVSSKATSHAPVYSLFSMDGTNQLTFAISETVNPATLRARLSEEEAVLYCEAEIPARTSPCLPRHAFRLRLDTRPVSYAEALKDVESWWTQFIECRPMPVPDAARLPMYSTWYSFHQHLSADAVEAQCRLAKDMGMDAVIVDDGWQTDDTQRGYAWCGDWEAVESKFPDFPAHVRRVQDMDMKYLLWFSVPFVGVHSKAYSRFRDCLLPGREDAQWWCLDPRCQPARDYLIEVYEHFVRDIGIDGLKLDFVDAFSEPAAGTPPQESLERRDVTVAEAAASLLAEISDRLQAINPEIMLEFRQSYIGPAMRRCGNIFRVGDVPNDFHSNRINAIDLRLLSGRTAVHSDMVMWNPLDSVESAAMQLLHVLFAVPQISVLLDRIPADHRRMLTYYLDFWRTHRDLLLDGRLVPLEPGMHYPQVQARTPEKWLVAVYGNTVVELPEDVPERAYLVNGTLTPGIVVEIPSTINTTRALKVVDCMGKCVRETELQLTPGLTRIDVPPAGTATLAAN